MKKEKYITWLGETRADAHNAKALREGIADAQ